MAPGHDIFTEKLIEVNPETDEIVWQWRSWEHIVQELDVSKDSYGLVHEHPNKINIAFNDLENGDWMHANGIFYDSSKDLIYMSVNFYSEVWVIDHSTNIQESATDQGGQYNRGGEISFIDLEIQLLMEEMLVVGFYLTTTTPPWCKILIRVLEIF